MGLISILNLGLDILQKAPIMVGMMTNQEPRTRTQKPRTVHVTRTSQSSWIRGVGYHDGILIILTGEGRGRRGRKVVTGAMLYGGVPSWVVGLLVAAQVRAKTGESAGQESVGATYSRLVKGKYQGQKVGPEKIDELRKLIGA